MPGRQRGILASKHEVYGILKFFIILPDLHGVDELNEGGKVLFLHRGLIPVRSISMEEILYRPPDELCWDAGQEQPPGPAMVSPC